MSSHFESTSQPTNQLLVTQLDRIGDLYIKLGDTYRSKTFKRAANLVSELNFPVTSSQQLAHLKGVGPSTRTVVDEFLTTGRIGRLEELEARMDQRVPGTSGTGLSHGPESTQEEALNTFLQMAGVGPVKAREFYSRGFRRIEDLPFNELTAAQQVGYTYYYHLLERIPRAEIERFEHVVHCLFEGLNLNYDFVIVGSYRRGEPDSGDIDLLVRNIDLRNFMEPLIKSGLVVGTISFGAHKFMGVIQLDQNYPARRLDVLSLKPEEFPFALLYFTGSKEFNVLMRRRAQELGYTLNEHRLLEIKTHQPVYLRSEREIFDFLGLEYLAPAQRVRRLTQLKLKF